VQSALSYQIARLERENKVVLFERTSRSVRLAPAGELLLPHARTVLAELDSARAELSALAGVLTGRLRLGMIGSTAAAAPMVERALAAFHRRHPAVEITIEDTGSTHMADEIRNGGLDLAFVGLFADQVPADLVLEVLAVEPLVAVVSFDHPLAGRSSVELGELVTLGAFVEMREESGLRRQVDAAFARAAANRTIAFELGASDSVVRFVGLGFGSAVVPLSAVRSSEGADGPVVRVLPLRDRRAIHPVSLLHRAPGPSAPSARALIALLAEGSAGGQSAESHAKRDADPYAEPRKPKP
jgi:DNA-binding transcriptional LysR family regulator